MKPVCVVTMRGGYPGKDDRPFLLVNVCVYRRAFFIFSPCPLAKILQNDGIFDGIIRGLINFIY